MELNTFRDARIRLCLCGLEGRLLAQANAIDPAGTTPHVRGSEMRRDLDTTKIEVDENGSPVSYGVRIRLD